jgi:hypothetical protein
MDYNLQNAVKMSTKTLKSVTHNLELIVVDYWGRGGGGGGGGGGGHFQCLGTKDHQFKIFTDLDFYNHTVVSLLFVKVCLNVK